MRWVMVVIFALAGAAALLLAPPGERYWWCVFAVLCFVLAALPLLSPRVVPLVIVALLLAWVGGVAWPFARRWHAGNVDVRDAITAIVVVVVLIGMPLGEVIRRRYLRWREARR